MTVLITAVYDSNATVTNVLDDLVATGIPRERIATDDSGRKVSVSGATSAAPEINEILGRHQPVELRAREGG